jgi:SagB-type dehydrogenase family enzyme
MLDRTNWPELRDQIVGYAGDMALPRRYPGYPAWPLPRLRARLWPSLDAALRRRRSALRFAAVTPSRRALARLLQFSHAVDHVSADDARGPTPSAGGLQGLELYLVHQRDAWFPAGAYHYDRVGHRLSQITPHADPGDWRAHVPSLAGIAGEPLLCVLVGDLARVRDKYGERAEMFLLLEAGHLMQNLCLLAASTGLAVTPLGAFFEHDIARRLQLPPTDRVLYLGVCGERRR